MNLTSIHYFAFLYLAFAHQTDGVYQKEERQMVWKLAKKWTRTELNTMEYNKTMDEVMSWYKSKMNNTDFIDDIFHVAEEIGNFDWFSVDDRRESLQDLYQIAIADRNYIKEERNWIRKIAKIWQIDF